MIFYARRLYDKGFFHGTSGNITVRLHDDIILVTHSGMPKDLISEEDLIKVDLDGNVIEGSLEPSSELKMHLFVYKSRKDVNAIIHAHPPFAVAYSCIEQGIDSNLLAESALILGNVPLVPYATPSTNEVPESLEPFIEYNNVFLLANHGTLTLGENIEQAVNRSETLESLCHVHHIASLSGAVRFLNSEQLHKLAELE